MLQDKQRNMLSKSVKTIINKKKVERTTCIKKSLTKMTLNKNILIEIRNTVETYSLLKVMVSNFVKWLIMENLSKDKEYFDTSELNVTVGDESQSLMKFDFFLRKCVHTFICNNSHTQQQQLPAGFVELLGKPNQTYELKYNKDMVTQIVTEYITAFNNDFCRFGIKQIRKFLYNVIPNTLRQAEEERKIMKRNKMTIPTSLVPLKLMIDHIIKFLLYADVVTSLSHEEKEILSAGNAELGDYCKEENLSEISLEKSCLLGFSSFKDHINPKIIKYFYVIYQLYEKKGWTKRKKNFLPHFDTRLHHIKYTNQNIAYMCAYKNHISSSMKIDETIISDFKETKRTDKLIKECYTNKKEEIEKKIYIPYKKGFEPDGFSTDGTTVSIYYKSSKTIEEEGEGEHSKITVSQEQENDTLTTGKSFGMDPGIINFIAATYNDRGDDRKMENIKIKNAQFQTECGIVSNKMKHELACMTDNGYTIDNIIQSIIDETYILKQNKKCKIPKCRYFLQKKMKKPNRNRAAAPVKKNQNLERLKRANLPTYNDMKDKIDQTKEFIQSKTFKTHEKQICANLRLMDELFKYKSQKKIQRLKFNHYIRSKKTVDKYLKDKFWKKKNNNVKLYVGDGCKMSNAESIVRGYRKPPNKMLLNRIKNCPRIQLHMVDEAYTSKKCAKCRKPLQYANARNYRADLHGPRNRVQKCPNCEMLWNRDINSSSNILQLGQDEFEYNEPRAEQFTHSYNKSV